MKIDRFEDLEVWKHARRLANLVYRPTGKSLLARDFGLRDQMRRAGVSIMSNIAEGFESRTQDPRLPAGGDGPAGQHRELRADRAPPAGQHQKEIERFEPRGGVGG